MTEPNFQGRNINLVKQHNLQAILLNLLYDPVLSRVQLARRLNLSNTTITNLIAELIKEGIVTEINTNQEIDKKRPVGRPRTSICLEPSARYVIGIHIGVGIFRVGLANLRAEIIDNHTQHFDTNSPVGEVLGLIEVHTENMYLLTGLVKGRHIWLKSAYFWVRRHIWLPQIWRFSAVLHLFHHIFWCGNYPVSRYENIIKQSGIGRDWILGVGVGASGLVDFSTGVNLFAPNLDWHDVPLRDELQKRLSLPVIVDNNVRTMAIAETYFGAGRGVDSVAFIYGRTGVGAGLTFKGRVFRGSSKGAGEIGHCVLLPHGGETCRCGNSGCLETIISESAILREAQNIAGSNPGGILARMLENCADQSPIECVFDAARQGDSLVTEMIEARAYYLGIALVNLINLFNPDLILLGGIFSRGEDLFIAPVTQIIQRMAFSGMGKQVRLQATGFGWKAGVIGAAALALLHFFYQQRDDCLS